MSEIRTVPQSEIDTQKKFIALLADANQTYLAQTGRRKTAFVHSYGCQQSAADGERIAGILQQAGYTFAPDAASADVVVFNTCAVREGAEDRIFGNTGALLPAKRKNPDKIIALSGCMVQRPEVAEKIRRSFPFVDLLVGTNALHRFAQLLWEKLTQGGRRFDLEEGDGVIAEGLPVRYSDTAHISVPVMYGCNNFCTYCIVPYVRGRERSRRPEDILRDVREVAALGAREITLLGQNVNSYGLTQTGFPAFPELLEQVCAVEGDFRVKFMTSHPKDASDELFAVMARSPRAARYLHLPVQSGSDRVLAAMNRRYTAAQYLERLERARTVIPGLAVTTDIIVGFPGETEEDFEKTLELIRKCRFYMVFMFLYSRRTGTPAAEMPDQIPDAVARERFARLQALQEQITAEIHQELVGSVQRVLVDRYEPKNNAFAGKADAARVLIDAPETAALTGNFVEVRITSASPHWVRGVPLE